MHAHSEKNGHFSFISKAILLWMDVMWLVDGVITDGIEFEFKTDLSPVYISQGIGKGLKF